MTSMRITSIVAVRGETRLIESELAPPPAGHVRVRTRYSAISAGTEHLTLAASVASGTDEPFKLGYQLAGEVESVAGDLEEKFAPGDLVACYGGPYVHHASAVNVPKHLLVKLDPGADLAAAAYCGLGAIGLHAFRSSDLRLGETAAVVGLGVLGNLILQIARAAGCRVVASDMIEKRRAVAREMGLATASDLGELACRTHGLTDGHYADAVFLAVGNAGDALMADAVRMVRQKGRVLIVGTAQAQLPREPMFGREAMILVPRAAGPGRYDTAYEAGGQDYPYGYVRWTEHRNLEEFIRLLQIGAVQTRSLITDIVTPDGNGHKLLADAPADHLGVVVKWP